MENKENKIKEENIKSLITQYNKCIKENDDLPFNLECNKLDCNYIIDKYIEIDKNTK